MSKKVEITRERLRELEKYERELLALEHAGVDNWEGFDMAMDEIHKEDAFDEALSSVYEEIESIIGEGIEEPAGSGCGYGIRSEVSDLAMETMAKKLKSLFNMSLKS